jgi:Methyltransferase domain
VRRLLPLVAVTGAVVDISRGRGRWLRELVARGVAPERLTGADLLPEGVEAARRGAPGADILHTHARDLPFPHGTFALVRLITNLSLRPAGDCGRGRARDRSGGVDVWEQRWTNPLVVAADGGLEAVAGASHPALYEAGRHPTAVCGAVGAGRLVVKRAPRHRRDAAVRPRAANPFRRDLRWLSKGPRRAVGRVGRDRPLRHQNRTLPFR